MTIRGIDISHHNGTVNFAALADRFDFAYLKASEGMWFVDAQYARNATAAQHAGFLVGAYHFLTLDDPLAQARHFAHVIGRPGSGYLPPIADFEAAILSAPDRATRLRHFLTEVDRLTGRKCGIYLSDSTIDALGASWPSLSAGRLIWVARYGRRPAHPFHIWQDNGVGMDTDVFEGTKADLERWALVEHVPAHVVKRTLRLRRPIRMRGADVKALQVTLNRHGERLKTDRVFGKQTDAAVRRVQAKLHLTVDGIVGIVTRKALGL